MCKIKNNQIYYLFLSFLRVSKVLLFIIIFSYPPSAVISEELSIDLNTCYNTQPGYTQFKLLNNQILLSRAFPNVGQELAKVSNGLTTLVKDLIVGSEGSSPYLQEVFNGYLYVSVRTDSNNAELWRTNGNDAELFMSKDNAFAVGETINRIYALDSFFVIVTYGGYQGANGSIWISDGTINNTTRLSQTNTNQNLVSINYIGTSNNVIYLAARTAEHGIELYKIDHTKSIKLVKDISAGTGSSSPEKLLQFDQQRAVFVANDQNNKDAIFITDGTTNGTQLLKSFGNSNSPPNINEMLMIGNRLFFRSSNVNNLHQIWVSNGTTDGTQVAYSYQSDTNTYSLPFRGMANNQLVFCHYDTISCVPWISNGTNNSTRKLADLKLPITGDGTRSFSPLFNTPNKSVFAASDESLDNELYITDGTSQGTYLLKNIFPRAISSNPSNFFSIDNTKVNFFASTIDGAVIYETDGTSNGTRAIASLNTGVTDHSAPKHARNLSSDNAVFFAKDCTNGYIPFLLKQDYTVSKLLPSNFSSKSSDLSVIGQINDIIYFRLHESETGEELWRTDGTIAGTYLVKDINPGYQSSSPKAGLVLGNQLIFFAKAPDDDIQLWITDGTNSGTSLLKSGFLDLEYPYYAEVGAVLNNKAYFILNTGSDNYTGKRKLELWSSDGTEEGTIMVSQIGDELSSRLSGRITAFNNQLYFIGNTKINGFEPWVSDGTEQGTKIINDLKTGASSSANVNTEFTVLGNRLIFPAYAENTYTIVKTDGTTSGTVRFLPDSFLGKPINSILGVTGVQVLFAFKTDESGIEPWISDGSDSETRLLKDLVLGAGSSAPVYAQSKNNLVHFGARETEFIRELYRTDGTAIGTFAMTKFSASKEGYYSSFLLANEKFIAFSANNGNIGTELYAADISDECPTDPNKDAPGACGCNKEDLDSDRDGRADCNDGCPDNPNKFDDIDYCGCSLTLLDLNKNGIADCLVKLDLAKELKLISKKHRQVIKNFRHLTNVNEKNISKSRKILKKSVLSFIFQFNKHQDYSSIMKTENAANLLVNLRKYHSKLERGLINDDNTQLRFNSKRFKKTSKSLSVLIESL